MEISNFLLIAAFALSTCSVYISYSMIGPFFPVVALEKGINETVSGFIFGIYGIVMLFVCPLTGRFVIPRFGPKRTAITGIIISAFANFAFSFLEQIESKIIFIITSLFLRATIAFGDASYSTSEFTMIMFIFSGQIGRVIVRE